MKKKTNVLAGSHLPVLIEMLMQTRGPVLELGMGFNSTPVMHWVCKVMHRELVSYETDPKWYEMNKEYEEEGHEVHLVDKKELINQDLCDRQWGVVLIDSRPANHRRKLAMKLKDNADFLILHDSEPEINRFYGYSHIYKHFAYVKHFDEFKPNTTILSNREEFKNAKNSGETTT